MVSPGTPDRLFLRRHRWLLAGMLAVLVKLWLVGAHDLMVTITPHDDLLFVNLAAQILEGNWLGPYTQLTLIKGAFYPFFIALSYWLNVPLLTAQQLLQAAACAVVVLALRPVVQRRWVLFLVFFVLLMNPFSFNYPAVGRVLQLSVYSSIGLLVFALSLGLALRSGVPGHSVNVWATMLGVAAGILWITRDESVWIVPSLALMLTWSCWNALRSGRGLAEVCLVHLLPLAGWSVIVASVCAMNWLHYGVFIRNELETPEFKAAYGGLLRIRTPDDRRFYPVVRAARQRAYEVSPALQEIASHLEGDIGNRWQSLCGHGDMRGEAVQEGGGCTDLPAAFFIWAFRDAVTTAGHHRDARETLAYYQRIGDEIDQACADGRLDCRSRISSLVPPWREEYTKALLPTFRALLRQTIALEPFSPGTDGWLSRGDTPHVQLFATVTGERLLTTRRDALRHIPQFHSHWNREKIRILEDIGRGYQRLIPSAFWASAAVILIVTAMDLRRRRLGVLVLFAWSIVAGIAAIDAILTLVQLTSYSSVGRAMHTAFPLVPLLVAVCLLDLAHRFSRPQTDM